VFKQAAAGKWRTIDWKQRGLIDSSKCSGTVK
jgi:hypothetical protein